jgi:tetratricopeptide (TPR) repeat protein
VSLDADDRAALEEERDFLLASLDDLERERAAGDVDDHDYRTLKADYTARAAAVLRALDADGGGEVEGDAPASPAPGRRRTSPRGRRLATLAGIALVAVLAGVLVAQASGRRGSGSLTGLDVRAASSRITECQQLEQSGDAEGALDCYSEVLDAVPANAEALTFRGWLQVREFDVADGLSDLDAAIQVAPESTAPYIFRASGRARSGDAPGAVADLAAFYGNDPDEEELALADQFAVTIVDQALDVCIEGDVSGSLPAPQVLQCYLDVLAVDEGNADASVYLGWLIARSGADDELALRRLDEGLEVDPSVTAGYVFRAALRAHLGDVDGAMADLAAFDAADAPAAQQQAADQVRAAVEAGQDPLPSPAG